MSADATVVAPTTTEEPTVIVSTGPKRDLHRMQRVFRGTKGAKLTTLRPFYKSAESQLYAAQQTVLLTNLKALTAGLTTEEVAKALADADPTPAVVIEMNARAARFGVADTAAAAASSSAAPALTEEQKAARDELMRKRAERFGVALSAKESTIPTDDLSEAIAKIDPAVLAARANRFADPRAEAEKAAAEKRAARFGNKKEEAVAAPAPVVLTPEQQELLDARARRFGQ